MHCFHFLIAMFFIIQVRSRVLHTNNFSCFECADTDNDPSKNNKKPYNTNLPCSAMRNIPERQCVDQQKFCRTQYTRVYNLFHSFERSCSKNCENGTRFQRYYLTQHTTTICCNTRNCNDKSLFDIVIGNQAPSFCIMSEAYFVSLCVTIFFS